MATLFPEDPQLSRFAHRFEAESTTSHFDPTRVRLLISLSTQARPKVIHQSIEHGGPLPAHHSLAARLASPGSSTQDRSTPHLTGGASPHVAHVSPLAAVTGDMRNSPKRPFPPDFGVTDDSLRPAKVARGESPLKGAAGRRLDAQKRRMEGGMGHSVVAGPTPLPRMVNFLLSILPSRASSENMSRVPPAAVMAVLRDANLGAATGGAGGFSQQDGGVGSVGMMRGGSGSGTGSGYGYAAGYGAYPQR
jgi:cleavage stimulation factor subunit 3